MPAPRTYRIENQRQTPVELHVAAEAVVLGPEDGVEVTDLTGQIQELARRGIVSVVPVPAAAAEASPPTTKAPAKRSAGKPATTKKTVAQDAPSASTRSRRGGN